MAKKFRELTAQKSPEWQRSVRRRTEEMIAEMPLQELRRAAQLSQVAMADALGATQPEVSKIERRGDLYVSTLRRYVEALGATLELWAHFPDGSRHLIRVGDATVSSRRR